MDLMNLSVVKEVVLTDGKDDFVAFIRNPMSSLTHFEIGGYAFAFYSDTFLMKLTKIFPRIETFIIDNIDPDEPQGVWNGITLLGTTIIVIFYLTNNSSNSKIYDTNIFYKWCPENIK